MSDYNKFGTYTRGEDEFSFNFNTSLSAKNKLSFISNVADVVVGDNYYDFLTDIMFDFEIINEFTDVDLFEIQESDNQIDAIEDFLNETNIVEIVKENAEPGLINELRDSVEKCIEYKTGIHRNILDEALSSLVKTFEVMVSSIDMDEMMKMGQMLSGISEELTPQKILEAYAETDMYKSSRKQITNASSTLQSPKYEA